MILKLMGGLLLTACGMLTGMYMYRQCEKKVIALREYIRFLLYCEGMIAYCGADIQELLSSCEEYEVIGRLITESRQYLDSGSDITAAWKNAVRQSAERGVIDRKDERLFLAFSEGFGDMDAEGEVKRLHLCREEAVRRLDEVYPESEGKRRLYRTVGTFGGVLLAALII